MKNGSKENSKLNKNEIVELFSTVVLVLGVIICYNTNNKIVKFIFLILVIIALLLEFYCIIDGIINKIKSKRRNSSISE